MTRTPHSSPVARAILSLVFATGVVIPLSCAKAIEGGGFGDDDDEGGAGGESGSGEGEGGHTQFSGPGATSGTAMGPSAGPAGPASGSGTSSSTSGPASGAQSASSAVSSTVASSSSSIASSSSGGGGSCCVPSFSPGCGDAAIEACVCFDDPYCCSTEWDDICVEEVTLLGCGIC